MNYRMILSLLGYVLLIIGAALLLPCIVALCYGEDLLPLLATVGICAVVGVLLILLRPKRNRTMHAREGFVMVSLSWIVISLVGALPFFFSGAIPSYIDAVFETVSGFTTTGASILTAPEAMPHGLLFWRSFTHWLGGMGVLVFMLAVVPLSGDSIYLLRAESPGPSVGKMVPKMRTSALILYAIYFVITLLQILAYRLGVWFGWGDIPVFDSFCLAFGTAGTGGFSLSSAGLAVYSSYEQTVTTVFMLMCGVNFPVYFFLIRRKFRLVWKNSELKAYLAIVFSSIALITLNLMLKGGYFTDVRSAIHHVSFSVGSIITTTGYGTENFDLWPEFSRVILVLLMIVGASAGSTGGGLKVSRVVILMRAAKAELRKILHPHTVKVITVDGKPVDRDVIDGSFAFLAVYVLIAVFSMVLLSLDNLGAETSVSAVMATLNNIGPGVSSLVGPYGSFSVFSDLSKLVMIADMLFGRLELFPMIMLLRPATWRKHG